MGGEHATPALSTTQCVAGFQKHFIGQSLNAKVGSCDKVVPSIPALAPEGTVAEGAPPRPLSIPC